MLWCWKDRRRRRLELLLLGWLAARWLDALWPGMPERIVMLLVLRYVPFFIIGILSYRVWAGQRSWRQQAPHAALALLSVATIDSPDMLLAGVLLLATRSEEHTSELQSLMRRSYAVFCSKKKQYTHAKLST